MDERDLKKFESECSDLFEDIQTPILNYVDKHGWEESVPVIVFASAQTFAWCLLAVPERMRPKIYEKAFDVVNDCIQRGKEQMDRNLGNG